MSSTEAPDAIRLRGVRHNNLKGFDLDLPLRRFTVITGLSGSGKSSLAFDTLFAEGQRRYVETFSPYARQFFDRMDKPRVDSIEGIPPAIAIEQRNAVKTTRSTVGTMTEICDHMKVLWHHVSRLYCPGCGKVVQKDSPQHIWELLRKADVLNPGASMLVTFDLPLSEKLSLGESLKLVARQGYRRVLMPEASPDKAETNALALNDRAVPFGQSTAETLPAQHPGRLAMRIEEAEPRLTAEAPSMLTIVQDRIKPEPRKRARFVEACEQAYHFGKGRLTLHPGDAATPLPFSNAFHCAECDLEFREPTPSLFSFNNPLGACESCKGFGRIIGIDYDRAIPDRRLSLAEGAVKPWQTGHGAECQADLMTFCRRRGVPVDVPFQQLSAKWQDWVIEGDAGYGTDDRHRWPRAWYGVKGYFRWLESKSYKMHVRVLLSRYRSYTTCGDCHGTRFNPGSLAFQLPLPKGLKLPSIGSRRHLSLAGFYRLPIRDAQAVVDRLAEKHGERANDPLSIVLGEVCSRLHYLNEVGLGYLTLDRPTRTLSGGETERVNLTSCLGTRLVNTLFVLDEPSVGLHPRDTDRLVGILRRLRDLGNTVVVVEHESGVIEAADEIVDLGPAQGEQGGELVFQGPVGKLRKSAKSLTGQYLSGRKRIVPPKRRPVDIAAREFPGLDLSHACKHNLQDLSLRIPLGRFVCVSGVSGSGKTTLVREVLMPLLQEHLGSEESDEAYDRLDEDADAALQTTRLKGWKHLSRAILVDQSSLGKTPRSNPAVYIGAFDSIRELFARTPLAVQRGLKAGAFSFNSRQGQCERCRGVGFEKIEMQFLSDVFIRCPECEGRRYRPHILEITLDEPGEPGSPPRQWNIADLLEATVDEVIHVLRKFDDSRVAMKAVTSMEYLQGVGLGYLRLGQPINTLSGGECQRLKLVRHLAAFAQGSRSDENPTLFLFDEPTTGLHFDDIRVLLEVFQNLVDAGHSVLVIEHNLEVLKCADWIVDLGPEAGDRGGLIVAQGTPEQVAACKSSHTGTALKPVLGIKR